MSDAGRRSPRRHPPLALFTRDAEATRRVATALGRLWANAPGPLWVVSLEGPLGAGKTHLAKGFVEGLGGQPAEVTSPTFTLVDVHHTPAATVFHLDCYRLGGAADAADVGWEEALAPPPNGRKVVLVEWADRVPGMMPADDSSRSVRLEYASPTARRLLLSGFDADERTAARQAVEPHAT